MASVLLLSLAAGCGDSEASDTELLYLDEDRQALIESSWNDHNWSTWQDDQRFYEEGSTQDGIRYYGSYKTSDAEDARVIDIVYIPCESLAVPSEITLGGYTFRSRHAFCLYTFSCQELDAVGVSFGAFYPLAEQAESNPLIGDEVLSAALQLHNAYEKMIYGSALKKLPAYDNSTEESKIMELQAAWLLHHGVIPTLSETSNPFYYGSYDGYDVLFSAGMMTVISSIEIAGEDFKYGSSFNLYAYRDGEFRYLKDVYEDGLISEASIAELAKKHREKFPLYYSSD